MRFASMMAVRPDRHTLLTEDAGTSQPIPPAIAAWRAGFWPEPAGSTWPMITASTASAGMPPCASAPAIAKPPSCGAVKEASWPLSRPCAVRAAATMTTSSVFMRPP